MQTVAELKKLLAEDLPPPQEANLGLDRATGHVLAEEVSADHDVPPFPRAMMDGYAYRAEDVRSVPVELEIIDEIPAGKSPTRKIGPGQCARIMTGAPVPAGADTVLQHEKTRTAGNRVELLEAAPRGANIVPLGAEVASGCAVLAAGTVLGPPAIAVAAMFGRDRLRVRRKPTAAVLATGDELVEPGTSLGPAQIRNSNGPALLGQIREAGFEGESFGIGRDDRADLDAKIAAALEKHDVLILTGGVSAGAYDLVIECLNRRGVETAAHKVAIKPGKPLFYGRRGAQRVFGLPGNPLSGFVTFEVFVRPFLGAMAGLDLERPRGRARLTRPIRKRIEREHYVPACIDIERRLAEPVLPKSSADIGVMTRANGFVIVPPNSTPAEDEEIEFMRLEP